jgi:hypothetical protein
MLASRCRSLPFCTRPAPWRVQTAVHSPALRPPANLPRSALSPLSTPPQSQLPQLRPAAGAGAEGGYGGVFIGDARLSGAAPPAAACWGRVLAAGAWAAAGGRQTAQATDAIPV